MPLFPRQISVLQRGLEAGSLRQAALAHNLANVNTPDYKAQVVLFEDILKQVLEGGTSTNKSWLPMATTHGTHIQSGPPPIAGPEDVRPQVHRDETRSARPDGNNVDVESEMARVAGVQIWYGGLSRQLSDEFTRLRLAITEGRR